MPRICHVTHHHPRLGGLRKRSNTACVQRPARCPPWTLARVGTSVAQASLTRRRGLKPWGIRLLRGSSLPRSLPPVGAPAACGSTHVYTRPPPPQASQDAARTRVCKHTRALTDLSARGCPAPPDSRPQRPCRWGARRAQGGRHCHAEEYGGTLTSPARAFHRELG